MPKLIDADKFKQYLTDMKMKYPGPVGGALYVVLQQIESGTFDPTPVQPDTPKPGDKVLHVDYKIRGHGEVKSIAKSGERAEVYFQHSEIGEPILAYYRIDKLEVIPNE
jgi:hypothetical protein